MYSSLESLIDINFKFALSIAFTSNGAFTFTPNLTANSPTSLGFSFVYLMFSSKALIKLSTNSEFSFAKDDLTIKVDCGYPFSFLNTSFHVSFTPHTTFKSGFFVSKPLSAGSVLYLQLIFLMLIMTLNH